MTGQPPHCNHEDVCWMYRENRMPRKNEPCNRNMAGLPSCISDTRSRPTTAADAPENPCIENGCTDIENCDEICEHSRIFSPAWVKQHDTDIRKDEREKVLKIISEGKSALYEIMPDGNWDGILQAKMDVLCWMEESLRTGAQK